MAAHRYARYWWTLDITLPVIQEAIEREAQLIVSHHPLIWDTHKHVTDRVFQQDKVLTLAENRIARHLYAHQSG